MKVKDLIAKQKEYKQIQQAREELEIFRKNIDALYSQTKALPHNEETCKLIESEIMYAIFACRDKLRKQSIEMEV